MLSSPALIFAAFSASWLGFGELSASLPADGVQRAAIEADQAVARRMFWLGSAGMLASFAFDARHVVPGRTAGVAAWGLGWGAWLGYAALADAQISDLSPRKVGLDVVPLPGARRGLGLGWRVAEF